MNFFEKVLNRLTSTFFNNTKLKNNTLNSLRIFFERNNKFYDSASSFGNVFRNSKWSDLKFQNIKNSFISLRVSKLTLLLLVILFFIITIGFSYKAGLLARIPLLDALGEQISLILTQMNECVTAVLMSAYLVLKGFELRLKRRLERIKLQLLGIDTAEEDEECRKLLRRLENLHPSKTMQYLYPQEVLISNPYTPPVTLTHKPEQKGNVDWGRWLRSSFYLKQTQSYIDQLSTFPRHLISLEGMRNGLTVLPNERIYFQLLYNATANKIKSVVTYKPETLSYLESRYTLDKVDFTGSDIIYLPGDWLSSWGTLDLSKTFTTTPKEITTFGLNNLHLTPLNFNIDTCLELAKQDRWLVKNMLGVETLDISNNAFTQSQKLLTTNMLLRKTFGSNIWLSSRFNNLGLIKSAETSVSILNLLYPATELSSTNNLKSVSQLSPQLGNFNFIEVSRIWTAKRYYLTSSLIHTNYTNAVVNNTTQKTTANSSKSLSLLDVFAATQAVSLPNNLYDLNLVFHDQPNLAREEVFIPVGDMQNNISEADLALNEDLLFLSAITSNITTDKRVYYNSWHENPLLHFDPTISKK